MESFKSMIDKQSIEFRGGPKDGQVWSAPLGSRWIPEVNVIPDNSPLVKSDASGASEVRHTYVVQFDKKTGRQFYSYTGASDAGKDN